MEITTLIAKQPHSSDFLFLLWELSFDFPIAKSLTFVLRDQSLGHVIRHRERPTKIWQLTQVIVLSINTSSAMSLEIMITS